MGGHSPEDIREHVRTYIGIFIALMVLTVFTVAVAYFDFLTVPQAIAIALGIATVKGSLVLMHFMHFSSERMWIYLSMILTVIFFFVLMLVPVAHYFDVPGR